MLLAAHFDALLPSLGCPDDCEAAEHATRRFMSNVPSDFAIAKVAFSNAFNILRRDMLSKDAENTLDIYRFCHTVYDKPTHLKFFGHTILSQEGAQQGDPLGPVLSCWSIHSLLLSCKCHLKIA